MQNVNDYNTSEYHTYASFCGYYGGNVDILQSPSIIFHGTTAGVVHGSIYILAHICIWQKSRCTLVCMCALVYGASFSVETTPSGHSVIFAAVVLWQTTPRYSRYCLSRRRAVARQVESTWRLIAAVRVRFFFVLLFLIHKLMLRAL